MQNDAIRNWNPWKFATFGILIVLATALITGVVVAHYVGSRPANQEAAAPPQNQVANVPQGALPGVPADSAAANNEAPKPPPGWVPSAPQSNAVAPPPPAQSQPGTHHVAAKPSSHDISVCNHYATSARQKTTETVQDGLVGGVLGAGLGAATGAIAGGGRGAGQGAGIGGLVGAAAGSLYGLNAANQRDQRAAAAYRDCMRRRGYVD
jgi:hypothetical protein